MSVHPAHTRCSERSSSAWMVSLEFASIAERIASRLPPRPASAVPESAAPSARQDAKDVIVTLFVVRMSVAPVGGGAVTVLAEVELAAEVDVQDQPVVLLGRQLPLGVAHV